MINRSSKRSFETRSPILPRAFRRVPSLSLSLSLDVCAESRETREERKEEERFRVSSILFGSRVSESRF